MTEKEIKKALNVCTFGYSRETRCKDCPLDSDKEPCMTNLHLAALEYIKRLEKENAALRERLDKAERRNEVVERALLTACVNFIKDEKDNVNNVNMELLARVVYTHYLRKAEKELAEERKE